MHVKNIQCANNPERSILLSDSQYRLVERRDFLHCGLTLDQYMSLIDPDWPIA
jgi:hypothetical protein